MNLKYVFISHMIGQYGGDICNHIVSSNDSGGVVSSSLIGFIEMINPL